MATFEDKFSELLKRLDTTTYKIALSLGLEPTRVDKVLFKKKPVSFEKRLEMVQEISKSPLIDIDLGILVAWLAQDYFPKETLLKVAREVLKEKQGGDN